MIRKQHAVNSVPPMTFAFSFVISYFKDYKQFEVNFTQLIILVKFVFDSGGRFDSRRAIKIKRRVYQKIV